jgi:CheY-like chemotaxis protein
LTARRYLLVDDNVAFSENLAEILEGDGAQVVCASGARAALEIVREQPPFHALVTDMRMPVMSGARLVHEIRRVDHGLPAIVVTAYSQEADLAAARAEGLLAVLPKPVPVQRFVELLSLARRDGLIALVEDDPGLSDNLSELLRDRGFSVVTAASVVDAERLGGVAPFATVVDVRVPGGPDCAALLTLARAFPCLPMLVMTAYQEGAAQVGSERLAAVTPDAVFFKPFDPARLVAALERLHRAGVNA